MNNKLLLNQSRNLEFDKSNITIPFDLGGDKEVIVEDEYTEAINLYNIYLNEREKCTTIRLTAKVNLVASNILFNSTTEIVKNEGSDECICLNYSPTAISTTLGKPSSYLWGENMEECTMDTQITWDGDENKNYTYLCGIDIFNNHILRSKKHHTAYIYKSDEDENSKLVWNTLKEFKYTIFGKVRNKWQNINLVSLSKYERKYNKDNTLTFFDSIDANLQNKNGWLGFVNKSQIQSLYGTQRYGNERVLNNVPTNKFVDMFPDRSRFSLLPHYNQYRDRHEKNWEYCLTYPSESTSHNIPFINESLDTLKIAFIDENEQADDGVYKCIIYSASKHGLQADDTINLYRSRSDDDSQFELVEEELVVDEILNEYVFSVYTSEWVCKNWISVFDKEQQQESGITHEHGSVYSIDIENTKQELYASSNYINADIDTDEEIGSQNLSFAKTVDGVQCRYYVRIFSRFPNFDWYNGLVTTENIYNNSSGVRPIDKYSGIGYEKQSTMSKLAFSHNIYGDEVSQIVYNDDINIDAILDNLNRPLTSLYLTFVKTNYGYNEWYYGDTTATRQSSNVEWSRCFGKINCGFEVSPSLDGKRFEVGNVHIMNNTQPINGLPQPEDFFDNSRTQQKSLPTADEIVYRSQNKFYGDLCMYSPAECLETVIQDIFGRFNTAQRECDNALFSTVKYHEIEQDQIEPADVMEVSNNTYDTQAAKKPEGYCYQMHYEIPVRSFSTRVQEVSPTMFDVVNISQTGNAWVAKTSVDNYFNNDTNLYLYNTTNATEVQCTLTNILDTNVVEFITDADIDDSAPLGTYKLYNKPIGIPVYAEIVPEVPGAYRWRDVVQNGFESSNDIVPEYPFNNGCLYINKDINIFLRRQDPFGDYGLAQESADYGLPQLTGERSPVEDGSAPNANDAIKESDIKC